MDPDVTASVPHLFGTAARLLTSSLLRRQWLAQNFWPQPAPFSGAGPAARTGTGNPRVSDVTSSTIQAGEVAASTLPRPLAQTSEVFFETDYRDWIALLK